MPGTEMATYEDDDTRLDFDVESDLSRFLSSVLQRTDQISQSKVADKIVKQHIVVVDQTVCLLRMLRDSSSNINAYDRQQQYAASQFCHLLLTGKSGQFSEEPRKETLTGQTLRRSRALCHHLHRLPFPYPASPPPCL